MQIPPIFTERLILRTWQETDLQDFAALNRDYRVMEFFPDLLTFAETNAFIERITACFQQHGFGLYACVIKETAQFIGYVGLSIPRFTTHFTPCVEIGWRLAFAHWGQGYATEAAKAIVKASFTTFQLEEIVSFTAVQNFRSRKVMEKLGMQHREIENFYHPNLPKKHPLSLHVLYRLNRASWLPKF